MRPPGLKLQLIVPWGLHLQFSSSNLRPQKAQAAEPKEKSALVQNTIHIYLILEVFCCDWNNANSFLALFLTHVPWLGDTHDVLLFTAHSCHGSQHGDKYYESTDVHASTPLSTRLQVPHRPPRYRVTSRAGERASQSCKSKSMSGCVKFTEESQRIPDQVPVA